MEKVGGANILFLIGGGNVSHKISMWPLARGLAELGHNVTFISPSELKLKSKRHILDITPSSLHKLVNSEFEQDRIQNRFNGSLWDLSAPTYDEAAIAFCEIYVNMFNQDVTFRHAVTSTTFDVVIVDLIANECSLYLSHVLGVKVIIYSSMTVLPWFYGTYGIPVEVSSIPEMMYARDISYPPGLIDRMWNFYRYSIGYNRRESLSKKLQEIVTSGFEIQNPPALVELERQASLVFLNTHYSTDFARSLPPVFVGIGGMQCWDEIEQLPQDVVDFMDDADAGVVLITFGSTINLSVLDTFYIRIFFNSMRKFANFRFIWKWNGPLPQDAPPNLMGLTWLQQRGILNHPKTVAFMTHGGVNSITEATFHAVPVIVMPLFVDQDYNGFRTSVKELGVVIEVKQFSQDLLNHAFSEVLLTPKYKLNMEVQSKIFKDRPKTPVDEAIWWTEFVLRHDDTSSLKPMLIEQSWWIRNCLDVYLGFFLVLGVLPILIIFVIRLCYFKN